MSRGLVLADVLDLRAYERVRNDYRREVMALKRRRRVPLGPIMTVLFECFDTVRFQVHEMARAERIGTDEGIQQELDVYNRLLPTEGELSATLFIELTSDAALREWLPALVGVERALAIEVGGPPEPVARSVPEQRHADALTRDEVTPAVHYLRFPFTAAAAAAFAGAPVAALAVHHRAYEATTLLAPETRAELVGDLTGGLPPIPLG